MKVERITLTGVDEHTDVGALMALVQQHPALEVGLLYTANPEGRNRYPSKPWIESVARILEGRCALHVCGGTARRQLQSGDLGSIIQFTARVQVNGTLSVEEAESLVHKVPTLITQHNAHNQALLNVQARNHAILIDASGGRGLSPDEWLVPDTPKAVGFAGGLGPDNLQAEIRRIAPLARDGAWLDMEGRLRMDDWFSVDLAKACLMIFNAQEPVR